MKANDDVDWVILRISDHQYKVGKSYQTVIVSENLPGFLQGISSSFSESMS